MRGKPVRRTRARGRANGCHPYGCRAARARDGGHRGATVLLAALLLGVGLLGGLPGVRTAAAQDGPVTVLLEEGQLFCEQKAEGMQGQYGPLFAMIYDELGRSGEPRCVPWARGYDRLRNGPRVALFPTARTPQREAEFQWVGPLLRTRWGLYARAGEEHRAATMEAARGQESIGTYFNDYRERYLLEHGFANVEGCRSSELNIRKIMRGRLTWWRGPA